jgi:hypothetical protein
VTERAPREYAEAVRRRYESADKRERGRLLDEYYRTTGCHRKAAIRRLRAGAFIFSSSRSAGRPHPRSQHSLCGVRLGHRGIGKSAEGADDRDHGGGRGRLESEAYPGLQGPPSGFWQLQPRPVRTFPTLKARSGLATATHFSGCAAGCVSSREVPRSANRGFVKPGDLGGWSNS